jgi:hypothetical protein
MHNFFLLQNQLLFTFHFSQQGGAPITSRQQQQRATAIRSIVDILHRPLHLLTTTCITSAQRADIEHNSQPECLVCVNQQTFAHKQSTNAGVTRWQGTRWEDGRTASTHIPQWRCERREWASEYATREVRCCTLAR